MFQQAKRQQAFLKMALTGPSGSGKTMSALLMASGLGSKIAVLDSENGSASLYSSVVDFDTAPLSPPFTTEKYIQAIQFAEKNGYDVLIIDSLTHAWSGPGGLLEQKEQMDSRGGNSFANWAKITPKHNALMSAILHSKVHVIATMRSKQDYVLADKNGKQVPQKVGLAPQQREGAEYEFTTVLDIAMNHEAESSKDRTGLFDGKLFKITKETGIALKNWLDSAEPVPLVKQENKPAPERRVEEKKPDAKTPTTVREMAALASKRGWHPELCVRYMGLMFGKKNSQDLTPKEIGEMAASIVELNGFEANQMLDSVERERIADSEPTDEVPY
jgi:hypothetical protein